MHENFVKVENVFCQNKESNMGVVSPLPEREPLDTTVC